MIKKFYLTRTQTRAMAADHPIGDPTGGAAYGEKNEPISAIIAISTMAGTYAAAGTFAAMTLMQGITFAGAALSLIGNVTGNKTLSKIGMIAGIAGGVGMAAESAGLFKSGTVGETFGMDAAKTGAEATLSQTPTGAPEVKPVAEVPSSAADIKLQSNDAALNTKNLDVNVPGGGGGGADVPVAGGGTRSLNMNPAVDPLAKPGMDILGNKLPEMSYAPGVKPPTSYGPYKDTFAESLKKGNLIDAAGAVGSGAMDMLKNNPTGAYVAAQAIGGLTDYLSGKTDSEIAALEANTGYADAKAQEIQLAIAKEKQRRLNMTNRYTSVSPQSNIAVNPNANAQAPGLVASNMQTRPA
jgi:hypothetical protein